MEDLKPHMSHDELQYYINLVKNDDVVNDKNHDIKSIITRATQTHKQLMEELMLSPLFRMITKQYDLKEG